MARRSGYDPWNTTAKPLAEDAPAPTSQQSAADEILKRRTAGVVHDERGVAKLLLVEEEVLSAVEVEAGKAVAPREELSLVDQPPVEEPAAQRRRTPDDMRKLNEWIKLRRAVKDAQTAPEDADEP